MYKEYDNLIIETTYQNTEEVNSYNLAEQAFLTFYGGDIQTTTAMKNRHYKRLLGYNTPARSYNLSFIDLSVLEEFAYMEVKVGDTIELNEPALGVNQEKVRVTSINYKLRDASKTQLGVSLIAEEQNILQKLLLKMAK